MHTRRSTLAGLCGLLGAMACPPLAGAVPSSSKPRRLRPGDTVGLIAPASVANETVHLDAVQHTIRGMRLVPRLGRNAAKSFGYLAGTDEERAADIHAMFADDEVRAVFVTRGGWGSARILPLLDWDLIRDNPKLLIGYSDATALHLAFAARTTIPTIHAPNAGNRWDEISWDSFWRMAFSGETPILGQEATPNMPADRMALATIRPGEAKGRLLGGNLTVLSTLMGTPWLPDFNGAILFLEDVGEAEYRIDRMLNQLALAGVLKKAAGVIFGQCRRCVSDMPDYAGFTVPQIIEQYLAPLGVPAVMGGNIGHVNNQLCLPAGAAVRLDAGSGTIQLLEPIVR